uniref:Uncharacterized protein n=1 Tax=Cucumis sativus TaxID=3659 RepID=A0A0A0KBD3_CUCSA
MSTVLSMRPAITVSSVNLSPRLSPPLPPLPARISGEALVNRFDCVKVRSKLHVGSLGKNGDGEFKLPLLSKLLLMPRLPWPRRYAPKSPPPPF